MGRKALVDYSLIKEICENLRRSKNKFKGQLELDPENGSPKEGKKVKEIKRLLVSRTLEKKTKEENPRKRKRFNNDQKTEKRFCQHAESSEGSSSSGVTSSSDSASSCDDSASDHSDTDGQTETLITEESDGPGTDNDETR